MKKTELTPHEVDLIYTDCVLLADALDLDIDLFDIEEDESMSKDQLMKLSPPTLLEQSVKLKSSH